MLSVAVAADLIIADFEGDAYAAGWTTTGEAFGDGPSVKYQGQQASSGYWGKGMANSFNGGDSATGTLTSPAFKIERPYINFFIGGGGYAGETGINLLVDGEPVRTATGPKTNGGTPNLEIESWDVTELVGRQATLQIVDQRTGQWGHILVDHIVQSETRAVVTEAVHSFKAEKRYLHIPVKTGAPKRNVTVWHEGEQVYNFSAELAAPDGGEADLIAAMDLSRFAGKNLTLKAGEFYQGDRAFEHVEQSEEMPNEAEIYQEADRPQFHFTSKIGWLNDPNGLFYREGEWHLYYQHNPYGWSWGNMHWGHAISKDLVHWEEQPTAIYQRSDTVGMAFSGCAVIDHKNTSGFGKDGEAPLVISFTDTGAGEVIAYSLDNGRSFEMYEGNPVVKHTGRDPKISWHEPSQRWIMALYSKIDDVDCMAFYSSPDLKEWKFESKNEDYYECPDLFELPVIGGEPGETRWVIYAADAKYAVGHFDGKAFTPEHEGKHQVWFGHYWAAQTYDNAPGDRRVQIGWARWNDFPGMPFNQQMVVPVELSLYSTPEGVRMAAYPVEEIKKLRGKAVELSDTELSGEPVTLTPGGEGLDVEAEFTVGAKGIIDLGLANARVLYNAASQKLQVNGLILDLAPLDGKVTLRILVDRGSIEVFANGGRVAVTLGMKVDGAKNNVTLKGSNATAVSLSAWPMQSIWKQ